MAQYRLKTVGGTQDNNAVARELVDSINRVYGNGMANMLTENGTTIEYLSLPETEAYLMGYLVGALNTECRMLDSVA